MFEALHIQGEKTDLTLNRTCQGQFLSLPLNTVNTSPLQSPIEYGYDCQARGLDYQLIGFEI